LADHLWRLVHWWLPSLRAWHPASLDDGLGKRRIGDRNPDGEQKSSAAMGRSFY
jgi:hypothetical protein